VVCLFHGNGAKVVVALPLQLARFQPAPELPPFDYMLPPPAADCSAALVQVALAREATESVAWNVLELRMLLSCLEQLSGICAAVVSARVGA
jgi:hypothetical protein